MASPKKQKGIVYLVGAGPGDSGLMTLRGAALLREADAVVYDVLVNAQLLQLSSHAQKIYAGKSTQKNSSSLKTFPHEYIDQDFTNRLLVKLARQGKKVVRLKGGDPFIFGRGGEEAAYLKEAGIPFEIVSGVSAGYAAPAYAGIPVTDRRYASQVTFVTAHENPQKPETQVDWKSLAALSGTLVIFMGLGNLEKMVQKLIDCGKSPSTPAAVIEWGTVCRQRVVCGKLSDISKKVRSKKMASPAVIVVGKVVELRKELDWFSKERPLLGKRVLVTRASSQAGTLRALLEEKGAETFELPLIQILPPKRWDRVDEMISQRDKFDWLVFTSANGVESFLNRVAFLKQDSRIFFGKKIAVVGPATSEALKKYGLKADLEAMPHRVEGMVRSFSKINLRGQRFLLARTDIAPAYLKDNLLKFGAKVLDLVVYRTQIVQSSAVKKQLEKWIQTRKIDFVTFASASTVRGFFEALPEALRKKIKSKWISIGPMTTQALHEYGQKPYREARVPSLQGILETITRK